nr:hypothetical protein [Tanacetum cinerariifolium]
GVFPPPRARQCALLSAHPGRPRRHDGPPKSRPAGHFRDRAHRRRPPAAGHLAGPVPGRAPPLRRPPLGGGHASRGVA